MSQRLLGHFVQAAQALERKKHLEIECQRPQMSALRAGADLGNGGHHGQDKLLPAPRVTAASLAIPLSPYRAI